MKPNLKILEVCPYSAGGCGVWQRAKQESIELSKKGYNIRIFSSYFEKGSDKIMPIKENLGNIKIQRFPAKKIGGESFMKWDFEKEALAYSPDIIVVHNYRHLLTTDGLKVVKKLRKQGKRCKIFLVTHAPFVEGNITRTKLQTCIVNFYDRFIGPRTLNKFDKILVISHWEIPYLLKRGAKKQKIVYIPNGIPKEFFVLKKQAKEENKILFLGRIAPKKKIETIIQALPLLKDKEIIFELVGPCEEEYKNYILNLIEKYDVKEKVVFSEPVYDLKKKIKKLDSCKLYVLASRVEGMPQGLIEVMSRGKIVVGSNSIAIRDLIKDKQNGYLFQFNNPKDLAEKIDFALKKNKQNNTIKKQAKKFVEQFSWNKIIHKIESLF